MFTEPSGAPLDSKMKNIVSMEMAARNVGDDTVIVGSKDDAGIYPNLPGTDATVGQDASGDNNAQTGKEHDSS